MNRYHLVITGAVALSVFAAVAPRIGGPIEQSPDQIQAAARPPFRVDVQPKAVQYRDIYVMIDREHSIAWNFDELSSVMTPVALPFVWEAVAIVKREQNMRDCGDGRVCRLFWQVFGDSAARP